MLNKKNIQLKLLAYDSETGGYDNFDVELPVKVEDIVFPEVVGILTSTYRGAKNYELPFRFTIADKLLDKHKLLHEIDSNEQELRAYLENEIGVDYDLVRYHRDFAIAPKMEVVFDGYELSIFIPVEVHHAAW